MPKDRTSATEAGTVAGEPARLSFEEALSRLEEIVAELEQGEQTLEKALELFEEGTRLSRILTAKLEEAQARIDKLVTARDGQVDLVPFGEVPGDE